MIFRNAKFLLLFTLLCSAALGIVVATSYLRAVNSEYQAFAPFGDPIPSPGLPCGEHPAFALVGDPKPGPGLPCDGNQTG